MLNLKSKKRQQGIALIFALAMLSLLLIMGMGFATNSIFVQKAAYNSSNTTSARLLCQSAVSRVLALLQLQISLYGETIDFSYDNWSANSGDKDMLDHLTTKIGDASIYTWNNSQPVTWEYIKTNDGSTDRLIGRFAYVVVPVGGINPAAVVKSGTREEAPVSATVTERRVGASVDEINIMAVSPGDIVASATPGVNQVSAGKFNYVATASSSPAGKLPGTAPNGYWTSHANMFTLMGITSGSLKSKFLKWFVVGAAGAFAQREACWVDRNGNGVMDSVTGTNDELFHRFNLFRTTAQWNAINTAALMNSTILCDSSNNGVPDTLPTPYPPPPAAFPGANDGLGIPWLAFFGYDKNGVIDDTGPLKETFPSVSARRRQIAANLIDYSDTTGVPSHDNVNNPRATWANAGNDPLYTGDGNTPYINEVGFNVHIAAVRTTATKVTITFTPEIEFEAINIYNATNTNIWMAARYSLDYKTVVNGVTTAYPGASTVSAFTALTWAAAGGPRYAKINFNGTAITNTITVTSGSSPVISVTECKLNVDKAVLSTSNSGTNNVDCSLIKKSSSLWTMISNWTTATVGATATPSEFSIAFQTNDPRQNLNPGDWSTTETPSAAIAPASAPYASVGTLGTKNIFNGVAVDPSAPSGDKDLEIVTEPAFNPGAAVGLQRLSTAYIRNSVMLSPWELGFIHRGAAWQTLNLKEYDPNKANKFVAANVPNTTYPYNRIPGGGAYSDPVNGGGDANILNQIKMGNATFLGNLTSNNKININSTYVDSDTHNNITLQALLSNIRIGNNPANIGIAAGDAEGSKVVPSIEMYNVINGIMNRTGMDYVTRAEVANAMYCAGPSSFKRALSESVCGIVQNTDAKQEELIGKFINLCDVGGKNNYFYVIITAQAIKDIGGPSTGAGFTISKRKGSNLYSTACKQGTFDFDNTNGIYYDEITAEQKVRLLVFADPNDSCKCKVLSYEFIE